MTITRTLALALAFADDLDLEDLGLPPLPDVADNAAVDDWIVEADRVAAEHQEREAVHLDRAAELARAIPFELC